MMTDLFPEIAVGEMLTDGKVYTFEAEEAIAKGQAVCLSADMKVSVAAIADPAVGVAVNSVEAGEQCSVCVSGIIKVTAADAAARGYAVKSADGGQVTQFWDQPVAEGGSASYEIYYSRKLGIALQTAAAGDTFLIMVEK